VFLGRTQCSRRHAFNEFVHAGFSESEAAAKAAALPRVPGPAAAMVAQPRDENATVEPEHSSDEVRQARELVDDSGKGPATVIDQAKSVLDTCREAGELLDEAEREEQEHSPKQEGEPSSVVPSYRPGRRKDAGVVARGMGG
jgi:hypothetical protein